MKIVKPSVSMRTKPSSNSMLETECLFGESVEVLSKERNWILCKSLIDNYIGWVKRDGLGLLKAPTHRIIAQRTFLLTEKNEKKKMFTLSSYWRKGECKKNRT